MPEQRVERVFLAMVETAGESFNPAIHARNDHVVIGAAFSQTRGQAGAINAKILYPEGGLLAGPRWGILSVEVDGVVKQVARGELVGFPLSLAGSEIDIELACKGPTASQQADAAFASVSHMVPDHVEPSNHPRRAEPYILADAYLDPRSLDVTLDPIAGSAAPALTLYGEGADPDVSTILSIDIEIADSPVDEVLLTETTDFAEHVFNAVDLGDALVSIPADKRATFTPIALEDSVSKITLDGGYQMLSSSIEYSIHAEKLKVYTKKKRVDPFTCIITPAEFVEYPRNNISDLRINALVEAVQDRRETLRMPVRPAISHFGGSVQVTETSSLSNAGALAETTHSITYQTKRTNYGIGGGQLTTTHWITRYGVAGSIWRSGGAVRATCVPSLEAMARRAARVAVERAHCVELTIETIDPAALDLTLKDRVRIYDIRLPGGTAVGKVTTIEKNFNGAAAIVRMVLSCPVSDPDQLSTGLFGVNGLAEIIVPSAFSSVMPIPYTNQMLAVIDGRAQYLVEHIELIDGIEEQLEEMGETDPRDHQIEIPESKMPETGIALRLADLSPASPDSLGPNPVNPADPRGPIFVLEPVIVRLPEGISL